MTSYSLTDLDSLPAAQFPLGSTTLFPALVLIALSLIPLGAKSVSVGPVKAKPLPKRSLAWRCDSSWYRYYATT